jgi:tetratricopeptide (TPR) repeat protein
MWVVVLAVVLGAIGTASAWWYHTTRPEYRLRRGEEALRRGDWDKAERITLLLEADGHSGHAHLLRGQIYLHQGRIDRVIEELNQIREDDQAIRLEAAATFGLGLLSLNHPHHAEHLLLYLVSKQPEHVDAHRGLAALYFDQGALVKALRHVHEWARLAPHDGYARRFAGVLYMDLGDNNEFAIASFKEALQRELSDGIADEVRQELAEVLLRQTEYAQALEVLDSRTPGCPETQKAVETRCNCLLGLNRPTELQAHLDQALKDYPRSVSLLRLRGRLCLAADDLTGAIPPLQQALQIDRHDTGSRYLLAQVYEGLGRNAEAAEQRRRMEQSKAYFEEMSQLSKKAVYDPWNPSLRRRLAEVCDKLDRYDEANMWRKSAAACPP